MIAFDLDDTLYKEIDYVKSGYRAIATEASRLGLITFDDAVTILEEAAGTAAGLDTLSAIISQNHRGCGFDVERMLHIYRYHAPQILLSADTCSMLDKVKESGEEMALISDGRSVTQRAKISALGLNRYFSRENIIISEETGADKTTPTPFKLIMERNSGADRFIYIGDNPAKDFHWPNVLGWDTVQLNDCKGVNIHSQQIAVPTEYAAGHSIDNISELLRFL